MKVRNLILGAAALTTAVGGLGFAAPAAKAAPAVCELAGTATLNSGFDLVTGGSGTYTFGSVALLCEGVPTGLGSVSASGNYEGSGATSVLLSTFDGSFNSPSLGCSGTLTGGSRVGGLVTASVTSNCGNGTLVMNLTPDPTSLTGTSVGRVVLAGAVVLT